MRVVLWTPEQDAALAELRASARTWDAIGAALGRAPKTCAHRARQLGLAPVVISRPARKGAPFTAEESDAIKRGRAAGWTWDQLGILLGRNGKAVRQHAVRELAESAFLAGHTPTARHELDARTALPAGHPVSWGVLTAGTLLEGAAFDP